MPWNAAKTTHVPEYGDPDKQEAADFFSRSFKSEFEAAYNDEENAHIRARPMIRGIQTLERLNAWTDVAKDMDVHHEQREALRKRRRELQADADGATAEFTTASQTDAGQQAIADGGAEVVAEDGHELDADQERVEYENEAERESKKREAAGIAKMFDDAETVREKIAEERNSDRVRRHVIDALEERLEVLE